jgi:sulfur-carrier protein
MTVRVVLPAHLRTLAQVGGEVDVDVDAPATVRRLLDALEARHPVLRGTIRDHGTLKRRPFLRFFACEEDLSLESPDVPLPAPVISGAEPFYIVGAIAGGEGRTRAAAMTLVFANSPTHQLDNFIQAEVRRAR